jgi:hypothetical protein
MPRKQKKYHYIYKTTCKITGKFYVGMHSADILDDGYLGSGKILGYSRKKYGDENHVREIVEMLPSREALKAREKEIVNEELLADPLNINLKYGGDGGWEHVNDGSSKNKENCAKGGRNMLSIAWLSPEYRESQRKLASRRAIKNHVEGKCTPPSFSGHRHSTESKLKISIAMSNRQKQEHSQFGTRWAWITDGRSKKKIPLVDLNEYVSQGWRRGLK